MDNDGEIRQGFICPICMRDLGDLERLHHHADNEHSGDDANLETVNLIKGMFAKAKSKLTDIDFSLNISGQSNVSSNESRSVIDYDFVSNKPQVLGATRSHTSYFNETQRDHTEIATVHTNTLILRLDKLLNEYSLPGANRKDFEKRTVPWADDSDFSNCRVCNLKFSLTKRKHHCRLCGKIICSTCSKFLSFRSAQKITSYVSKPLDSDVETIEENENYMRICAMCKEHLERYELRRDLSTVSSVFIDLYTKLCSLITQINNLAPSFRYMASSLRNGESIYTLEAAIQLRKKILYLQSEITNLSERIEKWGLDNDPIAPRKPTPREMIVQRNIRIYAITSIQDVITNMGSIPEIPNEAEYEELRRQNKERVANREKLRNLNISPENQKRSQVPNRLSRTGSTSSDVGSVHSQPSSSINGKHGMKPSASFSGLAVEDNWVPSNTTEIPSLKKSNPFLDYSDNEDEEEQPHPIFQQYLILKGYLKQAIKANREDEILSLEKSLIECKDEMERLGIATPRPY